MGVTEIITAVTSGLKEVGSMVTATFDFLGKGKLDTTEAMKQYYVLMLKVKEVESYMFQLQTALAEKLMVGATWLKYIALTSGFAIVCVCLFNIVCRTFGLGVTVEFFSWELMVILGVFVFVTSGSLHILMAIAEHILDWLSKSKGNKVEEQDKKGI